MSQKYAEEHGLTLDDSLKLKDLGRSAFRSGNLEKGDLGAFIRLINEGRIKPGSVLLVESFDRLSRNTVLKALSLFTTIIGAGLTIVTLMDEQVYSQEVVDSNVGALIISITIMARAHEESATKSDRLLKAWRKKQLEASSKKLTSTCPQWMRLAKDRSKFELIPEKVAVVRRILDLQRSGVGQTAIVRTLNQERIPSLNYRMAKNRGGGWHTSTIQKVITNPALYGVYQPTTGKGGKRVPSGDPISNYYPPVITKDEYDAIQSERAARLSGARGRKGSTFTNIFSGLLYCGMCGAPMNVCGGKLLTEGQRNVKQVVCSRAKRGLGCHFLTWVLANLERTVMAHLQEIDFAGLVDEANSTSRAVETLRDRLASLMTDQTACEKRLDNLGRAVEEGGPFEVLAVRLDGILKERDRIAEDIVACQKELTAAQSLVLDARSTQTSVVELYRRMAELEGDDLYALRARLASEIRRVVQRIEVFPGGPHMLDVATDNFGEWVGSQGSEDGSEQKPDRSFRTAWIIGRNGKRYATPNGIDSIQLGQVDKAETMSALGLDLEAQRRERQRSLASTSSLPRGTKKGSR